MGVRQARGEQARCEDVGWCNGCARDHSSRIWRVVVHSLLDEGARDACAVAGRDDGFLRMGGGGVSDGGARWEEGECRVGRSEDESVH